MCGLFVAPGTGKCSQIALAAHATRGQALRPSASLMCITPRTNWGPFEMTRRRSGQQRGPSARGPCELPLFRVAPRASVGRSRMISDWPIPAVTHSANNPISGSGGSGQRAIHRFTTDERGQQRLGLQDKPLFETKVAFGSFRAGQ